MTTRALRTKTHAIVKGFRFRTTTYSLIYIRPCPHVFVEQIKKDGVRPQANYVNDSFQGGQETKRILKRLLV